MPRIPYEIAPVHYNGARSAGQSIKEIFSFIFLPRIFRKIHGGCAKDKYCVNKPYQNVYIYTTCVLSVATPLCSRLFTMHNVMKEAAATLVTYVPLCQAVCNLAATQVTIMSPARFQRPSPRTNLMRSAVVHFLWKVCYMDSFS